MASVEPASIDSWISSSDAILSFTLAPQSIAAALGVNQTTFCPLHSLMQGLSAQLDQWQASRTVYQLTVMGHDQPLLVDPLPPGCALPNCSVAGRCGQISVRSAILPIEPAMLQRGVMRWLRDVGLAGGSALSFQPPPLDLWNPALNRSDWTPTDLLCDLDIGVFTMPALPFAGDTNGLRMPFSPPDGLLQCLSSSTQLTTINWQAARFFSSNMLVGLPSNPISLQLNVESLYGGVRPVPVGFFDPLPPTVTVQGDCGSSCARISSRCPYFAGSVCQLCPLGSFKRVFRGQYAYCSVCPVGSFCDAALSISPIPCPLGSFQPLLGQSAKNSCQACPTGPVTTHTFAFMSRSRDPQAREGQRCWSSASHSTESRLLLSVCRRAGMTTATVDRSSVAACMPCPAGWFCDPNPFAVAHSPCPVGSVQPLLSQISAASCTLCVAGQLPRPVART